VFAVHVLLLNSLDRPSVQKKNIFLKAEPTWISSSSGILLFNSRSMTPITEQAAVDDEEQRPLLQDIFKAAVDGHHV